MTRLPLLVCLLALLGAAAASPAELEHHAGRYSVCQANTMCDTTSPTPSIHAAFVL